MNTFRIKKTSGTYSELLETYGLSNTLYRLFTALGVSDLDIIITDKDSFYEVSTSIEITDDMINSLNYFELFKYIKNKIDSDLPQITNNQYFDYPKNKEWKKERNDAIQKIRTEYKGKDKADERNQKISDIVSIYETNKPIDVEFDVYAQISLPNNFSSFEKLYKNINNNREIFQMLIREILAYYSSDVYDSKSFERRIKPNHLSFQTSTTAIQLFNPNQGKGTKAPKANNVIGDNFKSLWITETMKISGALSDMLCQFVKVGGKYDLKVFVPEYKQVNYGFKYKLMPDFKKYLKGNTPIQIDIIYILSLTQKILEHSEYSGGRKRIHDIVVGLHSVYQKNLGRNNAVVNIDFIQVPNFIEIGNQKENANWIEILEEQKNIIYSIKESISGVTQGLKLYRDFISGSDINSFFKFSFWYATYLTSMKSKNKYVRAFSIKTLDKLYKNMTQNLNLMEIIHNEGFQAVAKAIRKSTVTLQYTPKDKRKYEVRYGIAQTLQTKSKSKEDLVEFIGEFIATYNSETARYYEKKGESYRSNVREDELIKFYSVLDLYSSRLIGSLLASYGFALTAKENNDVKDNEGDNENNDE
ncbi:hypothetical protein [Prevotella sp.]|uniref:hypothetical protein n=1 Tax=Prevotella sp. TaxID=59823 RepID=UPI003DA616B2